MATFTKIGPHQYRAQVRRVGFPHQTKTFETKREAQVWAREVESAMDKGAFVDRSAGKT